VMPKRQLPRPSELAPLLRVAPRGEGRLDRRLAAAPSIWDLREMARRRAPRAVFDYTDGAANDEVALARARDAFRRVEFHPRVLRDVAKVDPCTEFLGARTAYPFAFAPTGFTRMMHTEGEIAVGRVAQRTGIPMGLSTMGTTSIEELASAVPGLRRWFQLYLWKDREASKELVERARESGYEALILTVDVPVAGMRRRDVRNGFSLPPALSLSTILEGALHPAWWLDFLTTPALEFASMRSSGGTVAELIDKMFDPSVTMEDLAWLRELWKGPILVKGVQTPEDAAMLADAGVNAVVISNHGGRQLDKAPVPLEQLPRVLEAVAGKCEVYLDTGVMSGSDIVAAVALGARGVLVGRAFLYGLMAGGEKGVQRAAQILTSGIERTMRLLGVTSISELTPDLVRLRP
jgi:L-lactate dehydrogenase (cytochrome)